MASWANIRVFRIGVERDRWEWEGVIDGKVVCQGRLFGSEAEARHKASVTLARKINEIKGGKNE